MSDIITGNLQTTAIGSLPLKDPVEAVHFVLEQKLDIPFWPQLPKRDILEFMVPQFSEGVPCARVDREKKTVRFVDETCDQEMQAFYEAFLKEDPYLFSLSETHAAGWYAFIRTLEESGGHYNILKGHITGPVTFTLGTTDTEGKFVFYNDTLRDAVVKNLARNAAWQVRELKKFADSVIIFIDEPVLSAVGTSTYVGVMASDVQAALGEIVDSIHAEGALAGMHCCGNMDWSMAAPTALDILNFEADSYMDGFLAYSEQLVPFYERGGIVAWGIVPTKDEVKLSNATASSLLEQLLGGFKRLEEKGVPADTIRSQALLAPACGQGTLAPESATKVFELLRGVQELVRQ